MFSSPLAGSPGGIGMRKWWDRPSGEAVSAAMPLTLDIRDYSAQIVGRPILAAAGFQPALAWCEDSRIARNSRLKGGCRQDCLPHKITASDAFAKRIGQATVAHRDSSGAGRPDIRTIRVE